MEENKAKTSKSKPPNQSYGRYSENIEYRGHIYTRHNYFEDHIRKIDFILVTSVLKDTVEFDKLVTFIVNLMKQGVQYEISPGIVHPNLVFIKLHCPAPVIQKTAHIYNMIFDCQNPRNIPTVENAGFHWKMFNNVATKPDPSHPDYVRAVSSLSHEKQRGITSWERSLIMEKILGKTEFGPEPRQKGIKQLRVDRIVLDAYPMHDGHWEWRTHGPLTDRQLLNKYWANLRCIFKNQPIRLIYKYYGPEIAFYFVFVDYYTKMLLIPAVIGILCFVYNAIYCQYKDIHRITEVCTSTLVLCPYCYEVEQCKFGRVADYCYTAHYHVLFDNVVGIGFAIFCSMWATIFLGFWKRRQFVFMFHWNLLYRKADMTQRIEFALKAKHTRISAVSGERVNYMPYHLKFFHYLLSLICFIFMLGIIFLCLILMIFTRLYVRRLLIQSGAETLQMYNDLISIIINAFQSIFFIYILTPQFLRISQWLTNQENPASLVDYYNSCTYRFYFLSFFTNYVPIIYVALFKGVFFTYPSDMDNYRLFGWKTDSCTAVGCTFAFTIFLTIFLGFKIVTIRVCQFLKICIKTGFKRMFHPIKEKTNKPSSIPAWERDYMLEECGDLFLMTDFMDLVIQYGFVIFFVAGLPLSPVVALIINIIQVRLDAGRILRDFRRPVTKIRAGLGAWNSILKLITFVGAMTNALIIAFTSELIDMEVYRLSHDSIVGFLNSTFSEFSTGDYPAQFDSLLKSNPTSTCMYKARRNPSYINKKYQYSEEHWKVLCYKLIFVLVFQQMIWLLTAICSTVISHVPEEVVEELNQEALKVREVRLETFEQNYFKTRNGERTFHIEE